MHRTGHLVALALAHMLAVGIVIAVPIDPDEISRPIGEVALPPNPPAEREIGDGVPGRSGARRGGPIWAVPLEPDEISRPIGEVALPPDPPWERQARQKRDARHQRHERYLEDGPAGPSRSGSARGGPIWAVPLEPDEISRPIGEVSKPPDAVSRPIGEVALPAWITSPVFR